MLEPIAGENPSGENLRYAPVYDKIKEARREDDDAAQGDWKRERKVADWPQVIKLAGEALATKSKDLQLAAWITEALLKTQGISGLKEGLDLLKGLQENFWDTLYPEIEDGDLEMRATPLEWVGGRLEKAVKDAPVTRSGFSWFDYKESRKVATEEEAGADSTKAEAREAAIAEGKPTPEEFDKAFDASPKAYYVQAAANIEAALESLQALDDFCTEKFQDVAPGFGPLRAAVEEVQTCIRIFLQKKREKEPDEAAAEEAPAAVETESAAESWGEPAAQAGGAAAAPARIRKPAGPLAPEPADRTDAVARVVSAAKYLRTENAYDPAPYLMLRGLRWGELRAGGGTIDASILAAPPTEIRQDLKRLAMESNWAEALEMAEAAMAMECGRGWLDIQRYVCRACYELGYEAIRTAVISELRALLADYPSLLEMTLMDDTATANAETVAWIKEQVATAASPAQETAPPQVWEAAPVEAEPGQPGPPDAFDLAMQAARSGNPEEAIEILNRELSQERSGRGRFQRKAQLAQLCINTGHEAIAAPILQELAAEIERRKLEDWESPDLLGRPLALLYHCLREGDEEQRRKLFSWICRLDPLQALSVSR